MSIQMIAHQHGDSLMMYRDMRKHWWLLTESKKQIAFYGDGSEPTDHHTSNSTSVVDAKVNKEGLWLRTKSGSIYLVDWNRHRINLSNLIRDKLFLASLGVKFHGID